ncbi:hypothetical protein K443DRAFT_8123 [Laccaria amethystina LaAM-08-1]|uniref:Uncharacterized protein n=1 Tax=Laccaria amethystina LaAM-08-1 TaxID=1095629 RepID=A0A0C9XDU9_9AGAR|nr:hypothetical protein K443DRAFT_8123 [Laccaria amethystina LaAM-08-1]
MTWKEMGLEIAEDDFLDWYPEVMKQQSSYIVQEAKDTGTPNPGDLEGGKGKGEVLSGKALLKIKVFPGAEETN